MTAESTAVLLSLAVAGALVPGPILLTVLLLRARGGLIAAAAPGHGPATLAFIGFVVLSQAIPLLVVAASVVMPGRSAAAVGALAGWLERNDRLLVIVLGLAFGTWFGLQALRVLGLL